MHAPPSTWGGPPKLRLIIITLQAIIIKLQPKDKKSECLMVAQMMSCVQKNKTVCKMYIDIVESGRLI